jgi:NAD(P)-dependent dehydrogenase (short-subunit alcohol dehydrogenase family)
MFDFSDQIVLIAGGTGNLGRATARAFAQAGAQVALVDRDATKLRELFAEWVDGDRHLLLAPVDVMDPQSATGAVSQVVARFGRIDMLVNTVGGYRAGKPLHEMELATWDLMMNLNANCILPSTIDTPENRAAMPKTDPGKWVAPESLAEVILFLASPAAGDLHGAAVPVYGCA